MRKYISLIVLIVLISLIACQNDDLIIDQPNAPIGTEPTILDTMIIDTLVVDTILVDTLDFIDTLHVDSFSFELPENILNYENLNLPAHIATNPQLSVYAFENTPSSNLISNEGATLGRVLFYDPRLSVNNTVSCSSCHHQDKAFSTNDKFTIGLHGALSKRNSMSLINMQYFRDFFWDMEADGLEQQVLLPILDETEMGQNLDSLNEKLAQLEGYPDLFEAAFGTSDVTSDRISKALSQFIRSIVAFNSKFDQGVSTNFSNFSPIETDGYNLFYGGDLKCNHCHNSYNFFTRLEPAMNGLVVDTNDLGFYNKTNNLDDIGKFKIVSLRNIELTAPYMHDGRFETLEEVIEHYNSGMVAHPNLDSRLTVEHEDGGTPLTFNMTQYEKDALVAFLKTLTDNDVLNAEKYSNPFE